MNPTIGLIGIFMCTIDMLNVDDDYKQDIFIELEEQMRKKSFEKFGKS